VLAFQTSPLREPVQVVGPVEVELSVETDGPDTDFHREADRCLSAVGRLSRRVRDEPDGRDNAAALRGRSIKSAARGPGEVTRVVITLYPTGNLFLTGIGIRLDISSSNFPKFDVNPNTGEPDGKARPQTHRAQLPFMSTRNGRA